MNVLLKMRTKYLCSLLWTSLLAWSKLILLLFKLLWMSSSGSSAVRNYATFKGIPFSCSFSLISCRSPFWNQSLQRRPPSQTVTHLHQPLWWKTQPHLNLPVTRMRRRSNQEAKTLQRFYQRYRCPKSLPLSWLNFHPWVDPALATCLHFQCQIGLST